MKTVIAFVFFLLALSCAAQPVNGFNRAYRFMNSGSKIQDKNFYFLTLLETTPDVARLLNAEPSLHAIAAGYKQALQQIVSSCKDSIGCFIQAFYWTNEQNAVIKTALQKAYKTNAVFRKIVDSDMRTCGYFEQYAALPADSLITHAWQDVADEMNYIINGYALGHGFRYAKIDSASYYVRGQYYTTLVREMLTQIANYRADSLKLFFEPLLEISLELLNINDRDESVRHEPLAITNQAAIAAVRSTNFNRYPYSCILVLGEGPDVDYVPISPYGKLRCKLAATQYKKGKAPFIIVSGGYVHPFHTPYGEAIEMKKYLEEECGVPASAIFVDPHARHTTTNMRNGNRIIFRSGMPSDKKVLCVTSEAHANYIFNGKFSQRCETEIAHVPYEQIRRLNAFELEYYPVKTSLGICWLDPLDP